jgi:hypothetical protein
VLASEKWIGNYVEECDRDHFQVDRGIYIERMRKIRKIFIKANAHPCGSSNCVFPIYIAETLLLEPTYSLSQDLSLDH